MYAILSGERVSVRRPPTLAGRVEAHGGTLRTGWAARVVTDEHLFWVTGTAAGRFRHRRRSQSLAPGSAVVAEPGEVMAMETAEPAAFRALYVAPSLLAEVAAGLEPWHPLPHPQVADGRVVCCLGGRLALRMAAEAVEDEAALRAFVEFGLRVCAARARPPEPPAHAVVRRVREYLRLHYARTATLEELGRLAGMCKYALARAFSREVGLPPHAYQTHLRVLAARGMIVAGRPLSDVALEVGFTDQSHLCRQFKHVLGITPGAYARQVGARAAHARASVFSSHAEAGALAL